MLQRVLQAWGGQEDLWLFGYGSLIWKPEFDWLECRPARVQGWHRALKMWSRINRGTPQVPGLVLALLAGGSCRGMAFRIAAREVEAVLARLWVREMVTGVYDPRWLACHSTEGSVQALAFTLSRRSPSHTGVLTEAQYRHIFAHARGRYGTTLDYARTTLEALNQHGIEDRALQRLVRLADEAAAETGNGPIGR